MQVSEIMTKNVSTGSPSTNAAAAAEMMWSHNCGSLPIVEDGGRVIGMVTDRDLFIALGTQNRRPAELAIGEIMRREPAVCGPSDDVRKALKTMASQCVHRLPVVESGMLRGLLSIDDIVARGDSALKDDVALTLRALSLSQNGRLA